MFEIVQESAKVCTTGMSSRTLYAQHPVTKDIPSSPRFSTTIFYHDANSVLLQVLYMYSSINRLYAQNPLFEIVREESVKVYLHMYNGNVQQNLQSVVESCVTNPVFEIVQESVKVCTTGMSSRNLYASILSLRIFAPLPGSRRQFFITMRIQYS